MNMQCWMKTTIGGGGGGCEVFGKNVQYIDIGVCEYRPS